MKLEYRYGQVFWSDLHPGDMISNGCGDYIILTEQDIDENGYLKNNQSINNSLKTSLYEVSKNYEFKENN